MENRLFEERQLPFLVHLHINVTYVGLIESDTMLLGFAYNEIKYMELNHLNIVTARKNLQSHAVFH